MTDQPIDEAAILAEMASNVAKIATMTDPEVESAVLAEMAAKLEAEGLKDSAYMSELWQEKMRENEVMKHWLPIQGDMSYGKAPASEPKGVEPGTPYDTTCTYPEWMAQQQPAPLAYLRELVQLARESGMTHIRTGNLEMKFDPDARKTAAPAGPPVSF
jgi:hypothetical protein